MIKNMENALVLGDNSELERLVRRCIEHLKESGNICEVQYPKDVEYISESYKQKIICGCRVDGPVWKDEYSDRVPIPPFHGNLYALHVRCLEESWRLKYVGKSKDLRNRLSRHLKKTYAGENSITHSELWRVAHCVSMGCKVGVSCANVVAARTTSDAVNYAVAGYVESRIIDQLGAEQLWNKKGE